MQIASSDQKFVPGLSSTRASRRVARRVSPLWGWALLILGACSGDGGGASPPRDGGVVDSGVVTDAGALPDASNTTDAGTCALPTERPDGPTTTAPWRLNTLDLAKAPTAVCNDGTPGAYMVRRNPATTRWIIWLEGGGECHDDASCAQRWNAASGSELMSTTSLRKRAAAGTVTYPSSGVFSTLPAENPALHDANMVQIQYCSSDVWSGDHPGDAAMPDTDVRRWNFRGRAIAFAALADLLAKEGLDAATEITFGGGSAGAAGIFNIVDELRERAPSAARVIAIADAGYQMAYPAYDPVTQKETTVTPSPLEAIALAGYRNWGGGGDASCVAAASDEASRVNCRAAENITRHGYLTTPTLILNSQYDINQTARLGIDIDRNTGKVPDTFQAAFVRRFASRMRSQLPQSDAIHAIYSNYDVFHVTAQSDRAQTIDIGGTLERDAIAEWHRNPCSPGRRIEAEIAGQPTF